MRRMPDELRRHIDAVLVPCAYLLVSALVAGCASLSGSVISVADANPADLASIARIAINIDKPVLLRAVDEKLLPGTHVSSRIQSYAYALHPGFHVFWVSTAPYGFPLLPQFLKCYVIDATLSAGSAYELHFDATMQAPVLKHSTGLEPDATGRLVDQPFILERGCIWR